MQKPNEDTLVCNIIAQAKDYDATNDINMDVLVFELVRYTDDGRMKRSYSMHANVAYGDALEGDCTVLRVCEEDMPVHEKPCEWISRRFTDMRRLWVALNKKRPAA